LLVLMGYFAEMQNSAAVPVFAYARTAVYAAVEYMGFTNKQTLAEVIAKHIPAFERYVPPPRKPWMSEDSRIALFDAIALALVFYQERNS
jgi:hypothetical protein